MGGGVMGGGVMGGGVMGGGAMGGASTGSLSAAAACRHDRSTLPPVQKASVTEDHMQPSTSYLVPQGMVGGGGGKGGEMQVEGEEMR